MSFREKPDKLLLSVYGKKRHLTRTRYVGVHAIDLGPLWEPGASSGQWMWLKVHQLSSTGVPTEESLGSIQVRLSCGPYTENDDLAKFTFSHVLRVSIKEAKRLPTDKNFYELSLAGTEYRSSVVSKSYNPTWRQQSFFWLNEETGGDHTLKVSIMNEQSKTQAEVVGVTYISVSDLIQQGTLEGNDDKVSSLGDTSSDAETDEGEVNKTAMRMGPRVSALFTRSDSEQGLTKMSMVRQPSSSILSVNSCEIEEVESGSESKKDGEDDEEEEEVDDDKTKVKKESDSDGEREKESDEDDLVDKSFKKGIDMWVRLNSASDAAVNDRDLRIVKTTSVHSMDQVAREEMMMSFDCPVGVDDEADVDESSRSRVSGDRSRPSSESKEEPG